MNPAFFKAAVVEHTKRINALVAKLKSIGNDKHEKARNVVRTLNEYELRQLRFIATVHHKVISSDKFDIRGKQQNFLETCDWMIGRLEAHVKAQEETQKNAPFPAIPDVFEQLDQPVHGALTPKIRWLVTVGAGAVSSLLLPFFCTHSVQRSDWPYITTSAEEVANWPLVIFWTTIAMLVVHQTMKLAAKHL